LLIEDAGLSVLFVLAFANGANDVGKSVASLMHLDPGGKTSRRPLLWGGFFSSLGSVSAVLISGRLFSVFTPQSILRSSFDSSFVLAVLVAATLWVLAATLVRLPVSTTHAILGAITLQGIFLFGVSSLAWDFLAIRVLLPLAGGPLAALVGIYLFERLIRRPRVAGKDKPRWAELSHWGSAAATAFARGVNDAPKMAVLVGSLVLGHRVALTLIGGAFPLDHGQRLRAGIATAALVSAGAYLGAPLSTTHVGAGASAGVSGLRESMRSALRGMVLPWLVTLPAAGLLAIAVAVIGPRLLALV